MRLNRIKRIQGTRRSYSLVPFYAWLIWSLVSILHERHPLTHTTRVRGNRQFATAIRDKCGISRGDGGLEGQNTWRSTWDVHSSQACDLLGGNGRSRILQYAPEIFVADLVLPSETKKRMYQSSRIEQGRRGKQDMSFRITFGRSSTTCPSERAREPRRCEETICCNYTEFEVRVPSGRKKRYLFPYPTLHGHLFRT